MSKISSTHPIRILAIALIVLALIVFLGYLLIYLNYAAALFRFPFDYDQGEGFELMDSLLFSRGEWPYRDNSQYPFYASNYPPLFHLLVVPLIWLFGPRYWTGRLVSLLATLVTAATIAWVVQRRVHRPWLASLSGLAFLASNYVYHVGPLFRLHMTMVMFETLAIAVIGWAAERPPFQTPDPATVRAQGGPLRALLQEPLDWGNHGLWLGLGLLLAAGFTKQTAIVTCAAAFAFLALRGPKRALALALPFAAVALALFGAINLATGGQWWLNTVVANANPWIMEQAVGLYRQWFRLHAVVTLLAAITALYELYRDRLSIYTLWFVAAVLGSVMAGKWGAGESYFATAIAASCVLAGLGAGRALRWAETRRPRLSPWLLAAVPLLFLLQARLVFHMPTGSPVAQRVATLLGEPAATVVPPQTSCSAAQPARPIPYVDSVGPTLLGNPPTAADTAAGQRIAAYVRSAGAPPLSEEAGFSFYAGADVVTNPTQLRNLYLNGVLHMDPLLAMIEDRGFGVVVFRAQFYPEPVLAAIGQHYQTVETIEMNNFVYCVLRPRTTAGEEG
jgi:4-amino-4-deoxy-L-arabinose transferase-like glycosyltransferase